MNEVTLEKQILMKNPNLSPVFFSTFFFYQFVALDGLVKEL